jgi:hypothetical protein
MNRTEFQMVVTEAPPVFAAGDPVELIDQVPGRRELAPGRRAVVVVGNDVDDRGIWNMVSIVLGRDTEHGKAYLVRPRHLKKIPT